MHFCPKCGSLLKFQTDKNKRVLACGCGYVQKKPEAQTIKEKVAKKEDFEVIQDNDKALPQTEASCPKCDNGKAFYWLQQIRAGDEPETKFLKCTKCKHLWRENS